MPGISFDYYFMAGWAESTDVEIRLDAEIDSLAPDFGSFASENSAFTLKKCKKML